VIFPQALPIAVLTGLLLAVHGPVLILFCTSRTFPLREVDLLSMPSNPPPLTSTPIGSPFSSQQFYQARC
jgi:hypothetical protein